MGDKKDRDEKKRPDPEGAHTKSYTGHKEDSERAYRERYGFPEPKTDNPEGIPKGE